MKKYLVGLTILLALSVSMQTLAQKHRHTSQPTTTMELVDSTSKNSIEVFSDTTSADTAQKQSSVTRVISINASNDAELEELEKNMTLLNKSFDLLPWGTITSIFAIIFLILLLPIILLIVIVIVVLKHIRKRNRERMMYMNMNKQQADPQSNVNAAPEQISGGYYQQSSADWTQPSSMIEDDYQKGLRQCFVGVGLFIFLGLIIDEVGFGIGALVLCIGLGKVVGAKKMKQMRDEQEKGKSDSDL
ncbi:MAG: DUF6249 domain-containing protein [Prevotella sp.]|nr:DUF6249 domain-containing protein [Prevotella sp.]